MKDKAKIWSRKVSNARVVSLAPAAVAGYSLLAKMTLVKNKSGLATLLGISEYHKTCMAIQEQMFL